MPGYLLDTCTIRYWFERLPAVTVAADARAADSPLYVSVITLGEIEFGHAFHPAGAGTKRDEFIAFVGKQLPQILQVSRHAAEPYGHIRARLAGKFPPRGGWPRNGKKRVEQLYDPVAAQELGIDENDLWIAAQSVERNLVLVTSDKMARIRDAVCELYSSFRFENWAEPSDLAG